MREIQIIRSKIYTIKGIIFFLTLALIVFFCPQSSTWSQSTICNENGICDPNEVHKTCPADCPEPLTFLSTEGQRIINEKGHFVDLRGFHFDCLFLLNKTLHDKIRADNDDPIAFSADLSKYYCTDEDIKRIREFGANVVKIGFRWWDIKEKSESINESALLYLEEVIERFGRNGIYVIPCLTSGRQNDLVLYDDSGTSLWDTGPDGNEIREWIYDVWEAVAMKFKDNPHVAGYDIITEPAPPSKEALHDFYEPAIRRIRDTEQDKRHILFLEASIADDPNIGCGGDYEYENISSELLIWE